MRMREGALPVEGWRKNTVHTLEITGYTAEGMGVARLEGRVVFVPRVIQGEHWRVRLEKANKNVAWGRGMELLSPSPERLEPDCPLFGRCGGCQFRHMAYEEELRAKAQRVQDALTRLGGTEPILSDILGAENTLRYRNKVQFPVSQGKEGLAIGYYRPRSHQVLDAADCLLQPESVTRLRAAFRGWMERQGVPAYEEGTGAGLVRHLYLRTNSRGEALACVVSNGDRLPGEGELVEALRGAEPALAGVVLNTNTRDTNVILGERYRVLWGRDWLEEELCGLGFRLSVPSFFQINRAQTQRLYQIALDFAQLTGTETVLDLYCGIGAISLALARRAGRVIGAEIVPQAVDDARENARRNGISNAEFFCGDAGAVARKDRAGAMELAEALRTAADNTGVLRRLWRTMWLETNKPYGFEVIDGRLGAVEARLETARVRVAAWAGGDEAELLEELLEEPLPYTQRENGALAGSYAVSEIVSACKIDL